MHFFRRKLESVCTVLTAASAAWAGTACTRPPECKSGWAVGSCWTFFIFAEKGGKPVCARIGQPKKRRRRRERRQRERENGNADFSKQWMNGAGTVTHFPTHSSSSWYRKPFHPLDKARQLLLQGKRYIFQLSFFGKAEATTLPLTQNNFTYAAQSKTAEAKSAFPTCS